MESSVHFQQLAKVRLDDVFELDDVVVCADRVRVSIAFALRQKAERIGNNFEKWRKVTQIQNTEVFANGSFFPTIGSVDPMATHRVRVFSPHFLKSPLFPQCVKATTVFYRSMSGGKSDSNVRERGKNPNPTHR